MPPIEKRPPALHLYAPRPVLEQALAHGEFCLQPPTMTASAANVACLALGFSSTWDARLFAAAATDCCLVIDNTEAFGERIHRAVEKILPNWAGIDAAVAYGKPSPLGRIFSRERQQAMESEWLFAWRPASGSAAVHPVTIRIGSIENIASLRERA